ncbi:PsbP-related protein [Methanothermobacter tenebrarum]|uniref:PsbP-related protein n=1 Tax=Methanothermobacter tenebrarum TaxID=680118 RepID=UPI003743F1E2
MVSNNTTPAIPYRTYADNGITFRYPADWKPIKDLHSPSRWGYPPDPIVAFYDPSDNRTEADIKTYFYIKKLNVRSLDEQLSRYRRDIAEIGQTEVSERNITINGMRAVELIKTWYADGIQYQALTVHIEAVPGSEYYRIGCVTPLSEYNETLPKFKLVINSFKLLK